MEGVSVNTTQFREWVEIIGIFGIIASLVFVGLEMRQSQRIALSAIYQARADSSMHIRMAPIGSDALLSATAKMQSQGYSADVRDQLTPLEVTALSALEGGNVIYLENVHYQYLNGFISEEHWQTNREEIKGLLRASPGLRDYVKSSCKFHRESFCEELRHGVKQVEAELQ
jgi:hypothetical protein